MVGKRGITTGTNPKESTYLRRDVEDGARPPEDRKYRFRDNGELDFDDQRRVEFKRKLLESVEGSEYLQEYRKSEDEVFHFHVYIAVTMQDAN